MKFHAIELPLGKTANSIRNSPKITILVTITLVLLTLIPLYYLLPGYASFPWNSSSSSSSQKLSSAIPPSSGDHGGVTSGRECDIFSGEWIPNPEAPYYTNLSCRWSIHEHQNCMKYGRPDLGFMKWRWKPDECELPIFNPAQFLEIVRGKSMAFVGDSVARNQVQSLICLLSRVMYPVDISYTRDEDFKRWNYTTYNFTLATFWTPYLVRINEADPNKIGLFNLYLDEFNEEWTTHIEQFDYVIISAGHWFYRPMMFYEKGTLVGCHYCLKENLTDLNMLYGYRKAFSTAFKAINSLPNYKGLTILRTFAPSHFENGVWNQGGNCLRTKPFMSNETHLEGKDLELYRIQLEEFSIAEREGKKSRGLRYGLLDTTKASLLRPDGHPSHYGHWPHENVTLYNDCVHWCLPGAIDTWNDFLLETLKIEGRKSFEGSIHTSDRKMRIR
ncbi:protein trichome birefringence-like 19 [Macadamia integrifolia]|uniref:protein trichome birefringence-like 19 n=1 Tax=Macadamia integrifolia TaxID=60698 RepID=UPI001C4F1148|nr:protein trichome birefringence-like 19 [Macadamia integrifolia]